MSTVGYGQLWLSPVSFLQVNSSLKNQSCIFRITLASAEFIYTLTERIFMISLKYIGLTLVVLFTTGLLILFIYIYLYRKRIHRIKQSPHQIKTTKDIEAFFAQIKKEKEPCQIIKTQSELKKEPSLAALAALIKEA